MTTTSIVGAKGSSAEGILIVDDSTFLRNKVRKVLERGGFTVLGEAEDGAAAVTQYRDLNPALVTMDVVMPHMDGMQAIREIRSLDPGAKVVMVTSLGNQEQVLEALRAGALNFLVKPFSEEQLIRVVRRALRA
jgi:two-component system chemotaxis response regulator CheY